MGKTGNPLNLGVDPDNFLQNCGIIATDALYSVLTVNKMLYLTPLINTLPKRTSTQAWHPHMRRFNPAPIWIPEQIALLVKQ